jgi:signal transduction histidine kinase
MSEIACSPPAGLKPLDPGLGPEVMEWASELRTIWGATGLSMNQFATLHPIDKGTISRYLNGQRVPADRWFLEKLLAIQADNGRSVTSSVREHLTELHLRALQTAHPHEYKVRLVRDELEIALTAKREAERYARALEEQLAARNRQVQELADDKGRLRAAWDADHEALQAKYDRLKQEINEIVAQLRLAQERAVDSDQQCLRLEGLLDLLDTYSSSDQDHASNAVSSVAHELRSPLTSLKGFTATLLAKWPKFTDDQKLVMLETVNADADRMTRMITDLSYSSKIEIGSTRLVRQPVDLPTVAREIIAARVASDAPEDRFLLEVRDGLPETWLDPHMINQILGELVENAIVHGAGVVTIVIEPTCFDSDDAASVPAQGGADAVAISVRDQGQGIAPELAPNVFRQFWRTKRRVGTGLGLYIVKLLVEAHGGTISVHNTPAGGAEFRFVLPAGAGGTNDVVELTLGTSVRAAGSDP